MRTITVFILLVFTFCTGFTKPWDDKRKDDETLTRPVYSEGVVYALPSTVFEVTFSLEKEVFVPGPYHMYAKRYLGFDNAKSESTEKWMLKNVMLNSETIVNSNNMFKAMDSVAALLSLSPDGRLLGVNTGPIECEQTNILSYQQFSKETPQVVFPDRSSKDFYDIILDSITGEEKMVLKSLEVKAREAADYLIKLRKKRTYALIDSYDELPPDGKAYQVLVDETKRLEKEYVALFMGKTFNTKHKVTIIFEPEKGNLNNVVLCRFSERKGILPKADLSGKPIFINMVVNNGNSKELSVSEHPKAGMKGVYYNIPASCNVELLFGLKELIAGKFIVAQLGTIAPLPEMFLNGDYSVIFDGNTGAMINVQKSK